MNSHFFEKMGDELRRTKIDFIFFLMIVQNSYRETHVEICSLEDNRITYPKSIGSLGLCYTDAGISKRKVTN
jgi:hypothetical protein